MAWSVFGKPGKYVTVAEVNPVTAAFEFPASGRGEKACDGAQRAVDDAVAQQHGRHAARSAHGAASVGDGAVAEDDDGAYADAAARRR
eukprot:gene25341-67129_t